MYQYQSFASKEAEKTILVGQKLVKTIQGFIRETRKAGGVINTSVIVAMAMGIIITSKDLSLVHENGGHLVITSSWAKSILKRIGLCEKKEFKCW